MNSAKNCNVSDKYFVIHILNTLPEEYGIILNGLENHFIVTGDNALTTDLKHEKLNHRYEKMKSKKEEKTENEKALGLYSKQYKQQCKKCGKYGNKPGGKRYPENKNEKVKIIRKQKDMNIKIKKLSEWAHE